MAWGGSARGAGSWYGARSVSLLVVKMLVA